MLGILSLIVWTMFLIVTLKYVLILLNADNNGEGGTFALMALGQAAVKRGSWAVLALGVMGAAFFYGDAVITPAISVLSAVEGLKLVAPRMEVAILPITIVILVALFAVQSRGTEKVARFFGPITLVWFIVLAVGGLIHIVDDLRVFQALNPWLGVQFVFSHGAVGLAVMGLIFLVVTGAEALYADLGHFGRKPIRMAWLWVVQPALDTQLFRPRRPSAFGPASHRASLLSIVSELGAVTDGGPGDRRHSHRQPGRNHGGLLVHAPGDPAGPAAAAGDPTHV